MTKPLRCVLRDERTSPKRAQIFYFAWQDKSGDVWQDLAVTLLDAGLARVARGEFLGRDEYLRHEGR
ncbi:MAG: hypothetical protein HYZ27_05535 [Deltaproteobacteria bacterium]|nr:hypothetical protein [Deltaproteobacteria bacterium]